MVVAGVLVIASFLALGLAYRVRPSLHPVALPQHLPVGETVTQRKISLRIYQPNLVAEQPRFIEDFESLRVDVGTGSSALFEAILVELRARLSLEELCANDKPYCDRQAFWPSSLSLPEVYIIQNQRDSLALHFRSTLGHSLDILQEEALFLSIRESLALQGVTKLYILHNGKQRPYFLEQFAIP